MGVGIALGAPTGLTARMDFGDVSAMQISAGGAIGRAGSLAVATDWVLVFRPIEVPFEELAVPLYVGAGFKLDVDVPQRQVLVGPRAVGGATVLIQDLPVALFVEVAPAFYFLENVSWSMDGQVGLRYYL